jgi:trehalose 6-phosphate synthase
LAESLQETVEPLLANGAQDGLQRIVERFGNRERLAGVAIYDKQAHPVVMTPNLAARLGPELPAVAKTLMEGHNSSLSFQAGKDAIHVYAVPVHHAAEIWALAVFHDASYIHAQDMAIWRSTFQHVLVQMLLISAITLLIVRWTMERPIARMAQWLKDLRAGETMSDPDLPVEDVFKPITREVTNLATSLRIARASAEEEARLREAADSLWTAERLRVYQQAALEESRLFVVSNREPYEHVHRNGSVETRVPASGLVTAMEPILRACAGTWIAHGAGDADHETVDSNDRLRVPPDEPQYMLRRVWLTREEEERYYYGFANEGLWPLCHIAHTRPVFRGEDWEASGSECEVCPCGFGRNGGRRESRGPGSGLSFRFTSAPDQRAASRCAGGDLLAYSLAQSGSVRHLSLAAGIAGRAVGRRSDRLPYSIPLQ